MKNTTRLTALLTAAGMIAGMAFVPMSAGAELGAVPGQVDDIYDPAYGTGLGDVVMVLEHYAMTAAGLEGPINDMYLRIGAEVTGDDIIDLDDACAMLNLYAAYAAGLDVSITDYFGIYNAYDEAYEAYKTIAAEYFETHSDLEPAYSIVYIDDNMIPELVLSPGTTRGAGCTIYTYLNGEAVLLGEDAFGQFGEVECVPEHSIIINDTAWTGYRYITAHRLERGELTEFFAASIDYNTGECTMNGASSTESAVESAVSDIVSVSPVTGRAYYGRGSTDISTIY